MQNERPDPVKLNYDISLYIAFIILLIVFRKNQSLLITKINLIFDFPDIFVRLIFENINGEQLNLLIGIYIIATLVSVLGIIAQTIFFYKRIQTDIYMFKEFYRIHNFIKYILFFILIGAFYIIAIRFYFQKEVVPYDIFVLISDSTVIFFIAHFFVLFVKHLCFFVIFNFGNKGE